MPIIADIRSCDDEPKQINEKDCAILTLRNMVLFPGVTMPVAVGRNASLRLIDDARKTNSLIGVVCQKSAEVEVPSKYDIYHIGVIAEIVNVLELPDNSTNVILHGKVAFHLDEITQMAPYIKGSISYIEQEMPPKDDNEFAALSSSISELTIDMFQKMGDNGKEMSYAIKNIKDSDYLINFLACNSPFEPDVKMKFLTENSVKTRAYLLYKELTKESQLLDLKAAIQSRTREELTQQQRDHFLQQQIRTIQDELGINEFSDIDKFESRAKKMKWSKEVKEQFQKELAKLERLNPQSPDYSVQYTYLDQILNLPWNVFTRDSFNLAKVEKKLNHDHYGLENVKDRILEHLSVLKLRGDMKSPIICLYGPPGVGKTSLGRSIADALNRKYARISLGGLHDEAEIRGHRRTYIGAMPGRIIQALIRCKSSNPVFVLDEIDKIGNDFKGDPASALLEVLDPEQNSHFHDNYIDIDYDLSNVLFIATANSLSTISQPLLDRMEVIDISGYIQEEKVEIARKHLLPKQLQENGFEKSEISFTKQALAKIIDSYTRESGVRELDKKIAKVLRKIARIKATAEKPVPTTVNLDNLREYLGPEDYSRDRYEGNEFAGVVTGLAWTAVGGEILFVESSLSKGKGEKLTLTGNLGDVMKESAVIAMQYLKSHSQMLGIDYELFDKYNVHIHVPEGAIPKDGPSAGITMVTSLASSFTQRKVRDHLAMTGEITLRGKVLPVGGIKEKILAAKRAGITDIILCKENKKDIDEIKETYLSGLTFHFVDTVKEVLDIALLPDKVKDAIEL
ncbi:MAG: endopeptidase La [bacterium]|nr:endopeptidase La [bacterium]MDD6025935.1 endopeptidase La [bacterium]